MVIGAKLVNEPRKRQLQEAYEAGRKAVVIETTYERGDGLDPTISEVAEDMVVERLERGEEFVRVHFFMTEEQEKNMKRSKGMVVEGDVGRLVYLPTKRTKKGQLPQASDAAIAHARKLFSRVPAHTQIFWLTDSGLLAKTQPLTMTFASYPKQRTINLTHNAL